MTRTERQPERQRTVFARLFAVFLAAVLSVVGLGAVAPVANAQTPGVTTTLLHDGSALQEGAVVAPGDTLTVNTQYTDGVEPGSTVAISVEGPVTLAESSVAVPAGNNAIESVSQAADGSIQITFTDPLPEDLEPGVVGVDFTFDEVEETTPQVVTWTVNGETLTREVALQVPAAPQESEADDTGEDTADSEDRNTSGAGEDPAADASESTARPAESQDVSITQEQSGVEITDVWFEADQIEDWARETLTVEWQWQQGQPAEPPIEITLDLPAELHGYNDVFSIAGPDGQPAGTVTVSDDQITVAIDEAFIAENPIEVSGTFYFDLQSRLFNTDDTEHTFVFGDIEESVIVTPSRNWCEEDCEFGGHGSLKYGEYDNFEDEIIWSVRIPAGEQGIEPGLAVTVTDLLDEDAYELVIDDEYPQVWEGQSLRYNDWGREAVAWEPRDEDVTWSADHLTASFESREGRGADWNNYTEDLQLGDPGSQRGVDGTFYEVDWKVRVLIPGELDEDGDREFENSGEWTIEGEDSGSTTGRTWRISGGGDVVGTNFGQFELMKDLDGDTTLSPEFEVTYSVEDPSEETVVDSGTTTLSHGETFLSDGIFRGWEVTLHEVEPTEPSNVTWEDPVFTWTDTEGIEQEATTPWTFEIGEDIPTGSLTEITLQNEATLQRDGLTLVKDVVNDAGLPIQDTFVIDYSWLADTERGIPAGEGSVELPADGSRVDVNDLPVGADVTFTEREPDAVDNATWTVDIDPETVTIGDASEVTLTVTNTLTAHDYAVGDYVWIDTDRDGLQGADEEPLSGVTVELYSVDAEGDRSEEPIATTATDDNGRYIFDELPAGDYQIRFVQPDGYIFTGQHTQDDGSDQDSDANPGSGWTDVFTLDDENTELTPDSEYEHQEVQASHGIDPTWDAGFIAKSYAIGDYVWIDSDRDGQQDADEDPLSDVTVVLYEIDAGGSSSEVARTETDDEGRYIFDELPAGDYQVGFILTEEQEDIYTFTGVRVGQDAGNDSDAERVTGVSEIFTLDDQTPGLTGDYSDQDFTATQGIDPTWDAGVVIKSYAVGDYVWIDTNNDGLQDADEDPLPGVTVELYSVDSEGNRSEEPIATTATDENGRYIFDELPAGDYQVRFILTEEQAELYEFTDHDAGDGSSRDSDADQQTGWSQVFRLDDSTAALTLDYTDQDFTATQGIDPTWDAGVVLIEEPAGTPGEEETPGEDPPAEEPTTDEEPPVGEDPAAGSDEDLATTGVGIGPWALVLAALFLLAGAALVTVRRARART